MTSDVHLTAADEVTDSLIRTTLRDRARLMGRVRLPKRGCTKPALKGKGPFAKKSRASLRTARSLRAMRARWLRGEFTQAELDETRTMLETFNDLMHPEPKRTSIADAIRGELRTLRGRMFGGLADG